MLSRGNQGSVPSMAWTNKRREKHQPWRNWCCIATPRPLCTLNLAFLPVSWMWVVGCCRHMNHTWRRSHKAFMLNLTHSFLKQIVLIGTVSVLRWPTRIANCPPSSAPMCISDCRKRIINAVGNQHKLSMNHHESSESSHFWCLETCLEFFPALAKSARTLHYTLW